MHAGADSDYILLLEKLVVNSFLLESYEYSVTCFELPRLDYLVGRQ